MPFFLSVRKTGMSSGFFHDILQTEMSIHRKQKALARYDTSLGGDCYENNQKSTCNLPGDSSVGRRRLLVLLPGINHRSFMAGFTDLFLTVQHRSDKFTYPDSCEAYIAEKAEINKEPVVIGKARFGIGLREERLEPLQAFIYNDQEHPAQTVFLFPWRGLYQSAQRTADDHGGPDSEGDQI